MMDVAVAEVGEIVHRQPDPFRVIGAYRGQSRPGCESASNDYHRHFLGDRAQIVGIRGGAEQDEAATAVTQQRVDGNRFGAIGKVGRQQHLVAETLCGRIDSTDQLRFEELADVHQDAECSTAATSEEPCR